MNQRNRKMDWIPWAGAGLVGATLILILLWFHLASSNLPLPVLGKLSDFTLTNENNQPVSLASLHGQVWVADIIFTRCPGPCARMTRELVNLQPRLPTKLPVRIVTLTSDPDYDSPAVLRHYAERFGADTNRWDFLTGNKQSIRSLAVNDFKFVVVEKPQPDRSIPDDLFIHSTWFALVDQEGQVRGWTDREGHLHGYFDSEDPDARARLLTAIPQLLREAANP